MRCDFGSARELFTKAQAGFRHAGDSVNELAATVNLGVVELELDEGHAAEVIFRSALPLAEKTADLDKLAVLYCNLAESCLLTGNIESASGWLGRAMTVAEADSLDAVTLDNVFIVGAALLALKSKPSEALTALSIDEVLRVAAGRQLAGHSERLRQFAIARVPQIDEGNRTRARRRVAKMTRSEQVAFIHGALERGTETLTTPEF